MTIARFQANTVARDLDKKMVFVSGPRQVGKTTLSKSLSSIWPRYQYLNYDYDDHRAIISKQEWSRDQDLIILDEIHKQKNWKRKLKGVYDVEGNRPRLLITGSARLDTYRRGSDSLAGRYYLHRLYPLSVGEMLWNDATLNPHVVLEDLMRFGGFPEPYLSQSEEETARWRKQHLERILREDVQDLEPVRNIQTLMLLIDLLRARVGSSISIGNLARDLEVSPHTVKRWIEILEQMYVIFRVPPYHTNLARAILKEPKIYFYDTSAVKNEVGCRFENVVAIHLLKWLHALEDNHGATTQLGYIRDKEKREIDFIVTVEMNGKTNQLLIECKYNDGNLSPSLNYYTEKLAGQDIASIQLVCELKTNRQVGGSQILKASTWLAELETLPLKKDMAVLGGKIRKERKEPKESRDDRVTALIKRIETYGD